MIPVNPSNVPPPSRKRPREEVSREMLETSELVDAFCKPPQMHALREGYFKNRSVVHQKNDDTEGLARKILRRR